MSGPRPNPTASRRALAARLRRMRLAAGKSTDDAAHELMVSLSKISRLESGERAPQPRDVRDLARFYGASERDVEQLQELVTESRRKGWWQEFSTLDEQSETYYGLESAASRIDMFEALRWPGLLQTAEMTREFLGALRPAERFPDQFIEDQVMLRRKRQERLLGGDIAFHIIVDEFMFLRPMAPGVVRRQVEQMIEWTAELSNLNFQVVPVETGHYPGVDGSFHVLSEFEHDGLDATVMLEGMLGVRLIEHETAVQSYQRIFDLIAQEIALSPPASVQWLKDFLVRSTGS
jgi:transcriptional regulator with XRE-family HTH domain